MSLNEMYDVHACRQLIENWNLPVQLLINQSIHLQALSYFTVNDMVPQLLIGE